MNDTVQLRTRVPAERLRNAEEVLTRLGLTPRDAVNMLLAQIELRQGMPFEVSLGEGKLATGEQQMEVWDAAFGAY